jgi:hypothetical protein
MYPTTVGKKLTVSYMNVCLDVIGFDLSDQFLLIGLSNLTKILTIFVLRVNDSVFNVQIPLY